MPLSSCSAQPAAHKVSPVQRWARPSLPAPPLATQSPSVLPAHSQGGVHRDPRLQCCVSRVSPLFCRREGTGPGPRPAAASPTRQQATVSLGPGGPGSPHYQRDACLPRAPHLPPAHLLTAVAPVRENLHQEASRPLPTQPAQARHLPWFRAVVWRQRALPQADEAGPSTTHLTKIYAEFGGELSHTFDACPGRRAAPCKPECPVRRAFRRPNLCSAKLPSSPRHLPACPQPRDHLLRALWAPVSNSAR